VGSASGIGRGGSDMDENQIVSQFKKYGAFVILTNLTVIFGICAVTFPMLRDPRLLLLVFVDGIVGFILLFSYYLTVVNGVMKLTRNLAGQPPEVLKKRFGVFALLVFYLNMLLLVFFYIPLVVGMYVFFGYTNLYYHFFVFFIIVFVIIFLGYRSMQTLYVRTYPLGRFGIPVAIQGMRSKISSMVLPTVLLASVLISAIHYLASGMSLRGAIDSRVYDALTAARNWSGRWAAPF
jgi:hypothetical protein